MAFQNPHTVGEGMRCYGEILTLPTADGEAPRYLCALGPRCQVIELSTDDIDAWLAAHPRE